MQLDAVDEQRPSRMLSRYIFPSPEHMIFPLPFNYKQSIHRNTTAIMPSKPQLTIDTSKSNATPQDNPRSSRHCRHHTNHVDLVSKLRDPTTSGSMTHYMTTGRSVGHVIGVKARKQRRPKIKRVEPKITVEAYENFFGQNMSGSLSGSAGGFVADKLTQSRKEQGQVEKSLQGNEETQKAVPVGGDNKLITAATTGEHRPYQKPLIKRYPYPADIYKEDRSDEEYLKLFASLE